MTMGYPLYGKKDKSKEDSRNLRLVQVSINTIKTNALYRK